VSNRRYQAWPEGSLGAYQAILKRQELITAMAKVCLQEGIEGKNKDLINRLSRLIYVRAGEIQAACKEITRLLPGDRTGRVPKWYSLTLDIQAGAMEISGDVTEKIHPALKSNRMIYIGSVLKCIKTQADNIGALLEALPHGEGGLEVYREAVEEALSDFD
jgi:hypothetical protein